MRHKGTIVEWNDDRGFGFLEPAGGGERVFCHISAFGVRSRRPTRGDRVTYEIVKDERGRLRAMQIKAAGIAAPATEPRRSSGKRSVAIPLIVALLFFTLLAGLVIAGRLPWIVPAACLFLSVLAAFAYAFDKSKAMNRQWRTQESTLHMLSLLGGWPGAWIAQVLFRHKISKTSFMAAFVLCVAVNLAVLTWIVIEPRNAIAELLWSV